MPAYALRGAQQQSLARLRLGDPIARVTVAPIGRLVRVLAMRRRMWPKRSTPPRHTKARQTTAPTANASGGARSPDQREAWMAPALDALLRARHGPLVDVGANTGHTLKKLVAVH